MNEDKEKKKEGSLEPLLYTGGEKEKNGLPNRREKKTNNENESETKKKSWEGGGARSNFFRTRVRGGGNSGKRPHHRRGAETPSLVRYGEKKRQKEHCPIKKQYDE